MKLEMKPTSTIIANLGLKPNGRVQRYFTNSCYRHMDKYVPRRAGMLRTNVDIEPNYILYKSPYAHYMYKGKLYVDPKTKKGAFFNESYGFWSRPNTKKIPTEKNLIYHESGTGSYWDKRMWSAEKEKVISEVQTYFDRGSN